MFVIKDVDNELFLTKTDIFGDEGWCWIGLVVDYNPDTAPYIFSDMYEAMSIMDRYAGTGNCVVKDISL